MAVMVATMLVINRFRVRADAHASFLTRAEAVVAFFAACPGCEDARVVTNLDDPGLWAIVTSWADVGSYRRSFNGYQAKMALMPLLGEAIDEPSAYDDPAEVGRNVPRTT